MINKLIIALLSILIAACTVQPTHQSLIETELPPLLPVRDFVANTSYNGDYRISPDGKKLAWKAVEGSQEEIFVRSINSHNSRDDSRSLGFNAQAYPFVWAQDSQHLLFIKDTGGDENYHLFRANIHANELEPVDITPLKNTRVGIKQLIEDDPEHILVVHNGRDKSVFDLYRLNIMNGEMDLVYQNTDKIVRLITDRQGSLRARVRQDNNFRYLELPEAGLTKWKKLIHWSKDDTVRVLKFTKQGDGIHLLSNRGRDKIALIRLDTSSAKETVVYEHPDVDVSFVHFNSKDMQPALVYTQPDYPQVKALDPGLQATLDAFRKQGPAGIYVSSADDAQQLITIDVNDDRKVTYYLYDKRSGKTRLLGKHANYAIEESLSRMLPIKYTARDGLNLHGYLTLPNTSQRPLPMVMLVHGGPFSRYIWKYNRESQFLANRGYAVLQVNYRGSRGYGREFMQAAIGEFGGKMNDDLIDGVNWAIKQGIADKNYIAIMGRSFGGYATLVGLSKTPDIFACGIDTVGPADLEALDKNFPAYWKPFMHKWRKYAGNPENAEQLERMRKQSPIYHADKIKSPVLIIQGANDIRVKQDQSDRMVQALRDANKDVNYQLIEGEGHKINHWKNRLKVYRITEDFLAECLGGRSSGFDYYQLASWMF